MKTYYAGLHKLYQVVMLICLTSTVTSAAEIIRTPKPVINTTLKPYVTTLRQIPPVVTQPGISIIKSGTGIGTVSGPSGLYCEPACSLTLPPGTYTLSASPDPASSYFAGWSGDVPASCGRNRSCTVTVQSAPLKIGARFERGPRLTIAVGGVVGTSYVSYDPSQGGACNGKPGSFCTNSYAPGEKVTLKTSIVGKNYYSRADNFVEWSGVNGCGTGDICTITMGSSDVTVTAIFTNPVQAFLGGAGNGTLTSSPAGINCSGITSFCGSVQLKPGQPVTLTATPAAGSAVAQWSASASDPADAAAVKACGNASTCTFTPKGYVQVGLYWK